MSVDGIEVLHIFIRRNIHCYQMHNDEIARHTEKALLLLSSKGDTHAFTQLFHLHKHKLYSFLLRLTGSPPMTEDIIQDIFAKIWIRREQLNEIDKFGSYLFRMAQNHFINLFRKMAAETSARSRFPAIAELNSTEYYLTEKETNALLHKAIARLSAQQKLVYTLSREEGLKYEEIAQRLNVSPSTVKNHMLAALRSLRETFNAHPDVVGTFALSLSTYIFF